MSPSEFEEERQGGSMTSRRFNRRPLAIAAAAILAMVVLAACGEDDAEPADDAAASESPAAPESAASEDGSAEITLTADEYTFELSETPTAETESITFDNQGEEVHVMVFTRINEGFTLDEAYELQGKKGSAEDVAEVDAAPGDSATVDIEGPLEPGSYAFLCPIGSPDGPHYKLGQLVEFEL